MLGGPCLQASSPAKTSNELKLPFFLLSPPNLNTSSEEMGKKDSKNALNSSPIENHRRQMGKQEMKRAKKENKIVRKNIEKKRSAMTIQEIILVVGALIGVLTGIYFLFAFQMGTQWKPSPEKEGL